jgi:predicted N-acetyltransferase YhbS
MNYTLRPETEADYRETENVTREAFWDVYHPGCSEHLVLHNMRSADVFVKDLDLVACDQNKIIGNIVYSRANIIEGNNCFEALSLGPVCVLPEYQKNGVGSLLIRESLKMAAQLKYKGIALLGNPDYYARFGFKKASSMNIHMPDGSDLDALQVLELFPNSMEKISGRFQIDPVFDVDPQELENFEKQFPFKEKHVTDTQFK